VRARVLFVGVVVIAALAIAGPASAKVDIWKANIRGPGIPGQIRIESPDTQALWESGIDVAGGLDDARADSVDELGLTPADLGPRYLVTYRFFGDDRIRQDLYPYSKGGPVMYTPPGQRLAEGQPWGGVISPGWYQSSHGFFGYLVDQGLPETSPVAPVATAPDPAPGVQTGLWARFVLIPVALAALSLAALTVRRRGAASTG
jgi:hypothetical protein